MNKVTNIASIIHLLLFFNLTAVATADTQVVCCSTKAINVKLLSLRTTACFFYALFNTSYSSSTRPIKITFGVSCRTKRCGRVILYLKFVLFV